MRNEIVELSKEVAHQRSLFTCMFRHTLCVIWLAPAIAPGLAELASAEDGRVTELKTIPVTRHHSGRIVFSPDGKLLALPNRADGCIELWDLESGKRRDIASPFGPSAAQAFDAVFSKEGQFLAAQFEPGGVAISDLTHSKEQVQILVPKPTWLTGMSFLAGTPKLVTVSGILLESGIRRYSAARWNISTGKKEELHDFYPGLRFHTISPDGRYVLFQNGRDQIAFDSGSGVQIFSVVDFGESRFSPDCSIIVSYDGDGVTQWAVPSGKKLRRIQFPARPRSPGYDFRDRLAVSANNKLLAIGGFTGPNTVALVDLYSGTVLETFACCPPTMFCAEVRFSPSRRMLATDTHSHDDRDQFVNPLLRFWKFPDEWYRP